MSDVPPGPGWWKASDGNWYPPQVAPGATPPPARNTSGKGCLIAVLAVFALFAVLAVLAVVAITFLGNKASEKLDEVGDALTTPSTVDAANPDARRDDQVHQLGESARISGFTTTVRTAKFVDAVDGLPPGRYLVLDVSVENRDDAVQTPAPSTWTLQEPGGNLSAPVRVDGAVAGPFNARVTEVGQIVFPVTATEGQFFVLYRPDIIDKGRGVWPVSP